MSNYILTVIDVTGIQGYIFGSNKLRENIGASQLVENAIGMWMQAALPTPHNLDNSGIIQIGDQWHIEQNRNLQAEVVLRGGGNVLIVFRVPEDTKAEEEEQIAKAVVGKLSRTLLVDAPGLEIAAAHQTFDWQNDSIGGADYATSVHKKLFDKLTHYKQQRRSSNPLLGLGVTLESRATSLPAMEYEANPQGDEPRRPLSADVVLKLAATEKAKARLRTMFPIVNESGYRFRDDFDYLGGTAGEQDYIAIVHADANGMGKRFKEALAKHTDNRACINAIRALSEAVNAAGTTALQTTVERLLNALEQPEHQDQPATRRMRAFRDGLKTQDGKFFLPFRPIVYGGDDITFVCDGRLGLTLAAAYLEEWEKFAAELPGGPAYACASAVIVKTHYPFARAYALCEAMCTQVKNALRCTGNTDISALDWHFSLSSISGSIEEIRAREYTVEKQADLVMRPITLREQPSKPFEKFWQTWERFEPTLWKMAYSKYWRERRNKVKALREPLRAGGEATRQFLHAYNLGMLPDLDVRTSTLQTTGWDGICGYFDAIEAMDFFLQLHVPGWEDR